MEIFRISNTPDRLREAINESGKSQSDLVRETGIDKGALSCYLSGKYEPKQKAINKLAVALDVSEMWLYGYDVPKRRSSGQKKNDDLSEIVARLRENADFFDTVYKLYKLSDARYSSVKQLLSAFTEE